MPNVQRQFAHLTYDQQAKTQITHITHEAKKLVIYLETFIKSKDAQREKALAITNLEQFVMWAGKAVRNEQIDNRMTGEAKP